ncbi:hypothetical protein [Flavobacterium sp. NRK F7]|uniref:hypothetical protein n=1 Tax=Flavobacterium sp. NRK F7 TaxID=2954930 RepID=UPI002090FA9E|nr:hypothetical protein [Flavobacterium sp. NRK F7]MCO6161742.1 hypothetical protein [Flavobacterium sp. NRK F7]
MSLVDLSDKQLVALVKNCKLDKELKSKISNEINRRGLEIIIPIEKEISVSEKVKIILTCSFLYKYHLKKTSELIIKGNKKTYKQYWKYFNLGLFIHIIIFLVIVKYIIKPFF